MRALLIDELLKPEMSSEGDRYAEFGGARSKGLAVWLGGSMAGCCEGRGAPCSPKTSLMGTR